MYKEVVKGWVKHLDFMVLDILSLELSFLIAYIFRYKIRDGMIQSEIYRTLIIMIMLVDICVVFFNNSYRGIIRRGYLVEIKKAMIHCVFVIVGLIVWLFIIKQSSEYSRIVILSMYPISVILVTLVRLIWKRFLRIKIYENKESRKILVITTEDIAKSVLDGLLQPYRDYKIEAVILYDHPKNPEQTIYKIPVVTGMNQIAKYVNQGFPPESLRGEIRETCRELVDLKFRILPALEDVACGKKYRKKAGD